jgi:hypothetical protein
MHGIILEMIVLFMHLGPYNIFIIDTYQCLSRFNSFLGYQVVSILEECAHQRWKSWFLSCVCAL